MAFEEWQKRGQELYRQKKYENALECFNAVCQLPEVKRDHANFSEAIVQGDRDCVAALDNRAATHTKLGNLQAALRDGRLMIQKERVSCLVWSQGSDTVDVSLMERRDTSGQAKCCSC